MVTETHNLIEKIVQQVLVALHDNSSLPLKGHQADGFTNANTNNSGSSVLVADNSPTVKAAVKTLSNVVVVNAVSSKVGEVANAVQKELKDKQVVFVVTSQAAAVACELNRNSQNQAAALYSLEQYEVVRKQMSANVWVVETTGKTSYQLKQIFKTAIS